MARAVDTRRSRLLLLALVTAHVVAISHQVDAGGQSLLARTLFTLLSPPQAAVQEALARLGAGWDAYLDLRGTHAENQRLQQRLGELETELQRSRRLAGEAERLREILALKPALPAATVVAEVVAREGLPWFRSLLIDKGSADGLALNAPVISPSGVVGRIVSLGPRAAKVQLLLDRDAGLAVLTERGRVGGVLVGEAGPAEAGRTELLMKYVPALASVEVGERVLTSGLDGIFPKGLVAGRVSRVSAPSGLFREVMVVPSARFDQLEQVLVLPPQAADLRLVEAVR